jgi:ATP-binding cassette subfamily B protein
VFLTAMMFRYGNRGGLRRYSAVWRTVMPEERKRDYLRELTLGDVAAKEIRIFGINGWLLDRYRRSYWDVFGPVGRARRRIYFYPYLVITSVGLAVLAWVVLRIGQASVDQQISLTALALSLQAVMGAIALGSNYEEADTPTQFGMRAIEAMRRLRTHIERAEERERAQTAANAAREFAGVASPDGVIVASLPSASLVFHRLQFAYPGTNDLVLNGLDIEIPAGRSTAIVGVNGSGKTTLVKLLSRLYEPTGGAILADGVNIGLLEVSEWRRQVSVIFQDFIRYEFTAADNIAMGAIHAPRDDDAIREAARRAGILDALDHHPLGIETPLARAYKDGIDLSGGQWQRIAIARSLYALRKGAKILVLDEPTSALDVRAEVAFFDRFVELTHGVTSILISHRFSSVRRADHIVVIDGGRVSEQGSHAQLMKTGGHYERLFTLQADRFARGLSAEGAVPEDVVDPDALVDLEEVSAP